MSILSTPILLTERVILEREGMKMMNEEFSVESFMTWATRKAKGYSIAEIDHLARRVVAIKTHEEKTDCISRIRDALKAANAKLTEARNAPKRASVDGKNKIKYLQEHIEILNALLSRAEEFSILDHLDAQKPEPKPEEHHEEEPEEKPSESKPTFEINADT